MYIKTIVFDLYNTLIETGHSRNFFKELYQKSEDGFGMDYATYRTALLRKPIEQILDQFPSIFANLYYSEQAELEAQLKSVRLFPETIAVLQQLSKQYQLFLISNAASPYKRPFFKLQLEAYFEKIIFSCDCGFVKPERAIFKLIEQQSGNSGQQILMIGDSKKADIGGAKRMKWQYLRIDRKKQNLSKQEIRHLDAILTSIQS